MSGLSECGVGIVLSSGLVTPSLTAVRDTFRSQKSTVSLQ